MFTSISAGAGDHSLFLNFLLTSQANQAKILALKLTA